MGYTLFVVEVLIALGSNMGNSLSNLQEATKRLGESYEVMRVSSVYETAPMYVTDQPIFLNAAVLVKTNVGPRAILARLKQLEQEIGRQVRHVCGPREIDLDLIAYGSASYRYVEGKTLKLQVPHPRVAERRFVLQPLADVAPDYYLQGIGRVSDLLKQTELQADSVTKLDHALLSIPSHQ